MKTILRKFINGGLVLLVLLGFLPSANVESATSSDATRLDAFSLMLAAHALLGEDLNQLTLSAPPDIRLVAYPLQAGSPPSLPEVRLRQVQSLCQQTRQSVQSRYTGAELCEKMAIADQVCAAEIDAVETALARNRRGRGLQTFFRRVARRLDPGRINFGKFLGFLEHEVLPDSAQQIVATVLGGGNVVVRRVVRQTFLHKARQVIRANLTSDLLYSGVPPQTIQELGLPASQDVDLSQLKLNQRIDLQAIRERCQQSEGHQSAAPEKGTAGQGDSPDMIIPYMDRNVIELSCAMPSQYHGTNFVDAGAPATFDLTVQFDLKYGEATYTYDYEAVFNDGKYNENKHHGQGKGDYIGAGWFSGTEQVTHTWYNYILNIQTQERISSGARNETKSYPFLGAFFDDMSQAVFCRAYPYSNAELQAVGKEGLLSRTDICSSCSLVIK